MPILFYRKIRSALLAATVLLSWGCGEAPVKGDAEPEIEEQSFNSQLARAGLQVGSYELEDDETTICTLSFSFPGGQPVTEPVLLSGFSAIELALNADETGATIEGESVSFSLSLNGSGCLYFDRDLEDVWSDNLCPEGDDCPVFDTLEVCSEGVGQIAFSPAVTECGSRTFLYQHLDE